MNKLSKTSKLDNILSWSLQAIETCPGSKASNGDLVAACSGCYATTGMYNFPGVKAVRYDNKLAWQEADWVDTMVAALKKQRFFRWFDSGDMYSLELAEKMYAVMVATPHVKHWLPTRMHKFTKFHTIIAAMQALPNVMVRPSVMLWMVHMWMVYMAALFYLMLPQCLLVLLCAVHMSMVVNVMVAVPAMTNPLPLLDIRHMGGKWQRLFGWQWQHNILR